MAFIFLRSLVSGSHSFELLPEEYRVAYIREMTPGMVSVFCTLLGSTANTSSASVYEASLKNFTLSYVKGGLSDPEVDPRPHGFCKLWTLRSCSSSLSSTSLSLRKVVDVGCAGVVACPLCAATDCGRRCDAAATSSSCRPQQLE